MPPFMYCPEGCILVVCLECQGTRRVVVAFEAHVLDELGEVRCMEDVNGTFTVVDIYSLSPSGLPL